MTTLDISKYSPDVQASLRAHGETNTSGVRRAHVGFTGRVSDGPFPARTREQREDAFDVLLAPYATRSSGAGNRPVPEDPDPVRTCFERDLDRIKHSVAFRRLVGKQQVFRQGSRTDQALRSRLTHSREVAQVAEDIAQAAGLNIALVAAAATGHDCGHGPMGTRVRRRSPRSSTAATTTPPTAPT